MCECATWEFVEAVQCTKCQYYRHTVFQWTDLRQNVMLEVMLLKQRKQDASAVCRSEDDTFIHVINKWCIVTLYERNVLLVRAEELLTRQSFQQLCIYERSESGSNRFNEEDDTIYCWECFLLNVEGSTSLKCCAAPLLTAVHSENCKLSALTDISKRSKH